MRRSLLVAAFLLAGCAFEPESAERFNPPSEYREQWKAAEACTGRTGDFGRVTWWLVPGHSFPCEAGTCIGWWNGHDIYLAGDWVDNPKAVRHEMVHELLQHTGHPTVPFVTPCNAIWGEAVAP